MNKYEIMFIVKATMEEAQVKEVANNMKKIIEDLKGKVVSFKEMGERQLAYAIKKEISGYYFVMTIEATKEVVKEFDRKALIDESILRHLVIKLDEE